MPRLKPISSVVAALMIASALSGCGGKDAAPASAPSQTTSDSAAITAAAATKAAVEAAVAEATRVAEEAAAVEAAKVAKATAASEAKAAAAAKAALTPAPAPAPELFRMPNLIGENLQLAQDKLQALGSYLMDQTDAAGLDRVQVLDSNWQVCAQSPAPGKKVPVDTMVVLSSVKLAELCP